MSNAGQIKLCSVDDCGRRGHSKGLCWEHRKRQIAGKPLGKIRSGAERPAVPHPELPGVHVVPLFGGMEALIDSADAAGVSRYSWRARTHDGLWYAFANIWTPALGKHKFTALHRFVWSLHAPPVPLIDHRDRDGLNCRYGNLREATNSQNQGNGRMRATNTSGFKGVSFDARYNRWRAKIQVNGKNRHLGTFLCADDAAAAYATAASDAFGEFARLT